MTRHRNIISKFKEQADDINNEFKKAVSTGLVAGFGFVMALVWKEVITEGVDKILGLSKINSSLISAGLVTIIAVVGIMLVKRILK